jgi:cAMP-dependent protein kinase regulator
MSKKLIEVYKQAESDRLSGKLEAALSGFATIVQHDSEHLWSRMQVAHTLEALKDYNRAFEVYKALAWHCTKAGFPMLALDATTRASALQAGFRTTLKVLAEFYSLESERVDQNLPLRPPPKLKGERPVSARPIGSDKLLVTATQLAKTFDDARYPRLVPPLPLFSLLSTEAFYPILEALELKTYRPGETIIQSGEPATSLCMLAHGEVEVGQGSDAKPKILARLGAGSIFGEMALISEAPRSLQVVARCESDVLHLSREDIEALAEDIDDITWATAKFIRQRFINNLLLTSPLFAPFEAGERQAIIDRFTSVGIPTDEMIAQKGSACPGLYMILNGEVEVSKLDGSNNIHVANLKEGAVFGETSLVNSSTNTITIRAARGGEFLFLSREDFQDLIARKPAIGKTLANLSDESVYAHRRAIYEAQPVTHDEAVLL